MNVPTTIRESDSMSKNGRTWLLYHGIKGLLRCDESRTVAAIAQYVTSQYRILRALSGFIGRKSETSIPARVAFLSASMRFLEVRTSRARTGGVWIARLGNERRALEGLPLIMPQIQWTEWLFRRRPSKSAILALVRQLIPNRRRIIRLASLLLRRRLEFFRVLRVIELIGYYARYLELFQNGSYSLAIMSSHSNPHGIAFNLAARKCGVPVILLTHGMPVKPIANLAYSVAVVHCEAARQIYLEAGSRIDRMFIHGRRHHYVAMPDSLADALSVGIFLCKDVNEARLQALTENLLRDPRVIQILVRPHSKNLWRGFDAWIKSKNDHRLCQSHAKAAQDDIARSDIVLGGNSSVLIEAVTAGRPSGYVAGLDHGSPDLHEFVARGLLYPLSDDSELDPDAMLRFYQRPDWSMALRLFSNINEDEEMVMKRTALAIQQLAQGKVM